ncbi:MAG: hypothetical protein HY700_18905 [Gemmatimonadetes bacterium]|nr:hypothetical protein [Gemmatimonadota bacterium]
MRYWMPGVLLFLWGTAPGEAQQEAPGHGIRETVASLRIGTQIRIRDRSGTVVQGRYEGITASELSLSEPGERRQVTAIDSLWVRGGSAKKGVLIGAPSAGIPSALFIGFLAAGISETLCDDPPDCSADGSALAVAAGAVAGSLGAAVGAGVGAAAGSLVRHWTLVFPAAARTPRPHWRRIMLHYATTRASVADADPRGGLRGGRLGLWFPFRFFAIGPEVSYQRIGSRIVTNYYAKAPPTDYSPSPRLDLGNTSVMTAAAAARIRPFGGWIQPYALASVGFRPRRTHFTESEPCPSCPPATLGPSGSLIVRTTVAPWIDWALGFGGGFGIGVDLAPPKLPLAIGAEVRRDTNPAFVTIGLNLGVRW